jgi:spore germination cell wall hydrolase CwlJ-like protein
MVGTVLGEQKQSNISPEAICLANNIYHEARGESFTGKLAVALVTINRTKAVEFPDTICKVVYQEGQFSWTRTKQKVNDYNAWSDALTLANMAIDNPNILGNFRAKHYHASNINPGWRLPRIAKIGNHIFYA